MKNNYISPKHKFNEKVACFIFLHIFYNIWLTITRFSCLLLHSNNVIYEVLTEVYEKKFSFRSTARKRVFQPFQIIVSIFF